MQSKRAVLIQSSLDQGRYGQRIGAAVSSSTVSRLSPTAHSAPLCSVGRRRVHVAWALAQFGRMAISAAPRLLDCLVQMGKQAIKQKKPVVGQMSICVCFNCVASASGTQEEEKGGRGALVKG